MTDDLVIKHQHDLGRIRLQAQLRREEKTEIQEALADVERIKGQNEQSLARLSHELNVENRALDLQYQEHQNAQALRLETLQTTLKQHDDFFRFFWELDKDVLALETRIIELWTAAQIQQDQTRLEHSNEMEARRADQAHELVMQEQERITLTHKNDLDKDNFDFK